MAPPTAQGHETPSLRLYATANSDCSTRLRLALKLKGIPYTAVEGGRPAGDGRPSGYERINPANALPTLVVVVNADDNGSHEHAISQSLAALEFLDETFPASCPLLPASPLARAQARSLAAIVASDTHPLTAPRIGKRIAAQFTAGVPEADHKARVAEWDLFFIQRGLHVYEQTVGQSAGRFSVGDAVSLADLCLLPQAWRAVKRGVDMAAYPVIQRIMGNLEQVEGVRACHWDEQLDVGGA